MRDKENNMRIINPINCLAWSVLLNIRDLRVYSNRICFEPDISGTA